tara:strand:+ start:153 stop:398 length:246 start_codon:yes stop_codon:yes gene_type:complete
MIIRESKGFINAMKHVKNKELKKRIFKQVEKMIKNPDVGKPMKHERKNTREVYIKSLRLSYMYSKEKNRIILLDLYHKDEQ